MTATRPSARDAVQPSLWDRLVNDLPGLTSEIAGLRRALERKLGADRLAKAIAARRPETAGDMTAQARDDLARLLHLEQRRALLEDRTVVVSSQVLREAVRRDIEALFNTARFEARLMLTDLEAASAPDTPATLDDFPRVRRSVVNYGMPSFSGRTRWDFDEATLREEIRQVLIAFEPRLKRDTIRVTIGKGDREGMRIEISGLLMTAPVPERLRLRTTIDLDNGRAATALEDA
ncbi:MAG TPA: type VI secretion system baseplate subunit TssE [Thermohalobaculum sp.]|nr:type VI secretion system baseplate subunit TssE [Thermohalobaculum sp.]